MLVQFYLTPFFLCNQGEDPSKATAIVVTGPEMENFQEQDWNRVFSHKDVVFARTQPSQKQDIVRALHKRGHVVAMTGDGVKYEIVTVSTNTGKLTDFNSF
jgi:magnesium-transporting ATPase (P-type)